MADMVLTKDEIMETIATGVNDFVDTIVKENVEEANIKITIKPEEVLIMMKKTNNLDKTLGAELN